MYGFPPLALPVLKLQKPIGSDRWTILPSINGFRLMPSNGRLGTGRPMISHRVGRMSLVPVLTFEPREREIFAGHSITPGTRIPPSYIVPFRPRNGEVPIPPAGVPLSPQYHRIVFFRTAA